MRKFDNLNQSTWTLGCKLRLSQQVLKPLFAQIVFELAENVYNSKNGIPHFGFIFKMKTK
jgi:hypothetical protein